MRLAWMLVLVACVRGGDSTTPAGPGDGKTGPAADRLDAAIERGLAVLDGRTETTPRGPRLDQQRVRLAVEDGATTAAVRVIYAYELACKFCSEARGLLAAIRERHGDRVAVVRLPFLVHRVQSMGAHLVACAAGPRQAAVEDVIFDELLPAGDYTSARLLAVAARAGLPEADVVAAIEAGACTERIVADHLLVHRAGVRGTPTFLINGLPVEGLGPAHVDALIAEELARVDAFVAAGGTIADYHATWQRDARPL